MLIIRIIASNYKSENKIEKSGEITYNTAVGTRFIRWGSGWSDHPSKNGKERMITRLHRSCRIFMRKNVANILWGLFFIGIGVGLIGNVLGFWDFSVFFKGWWTLFIIIPALVSMVQSGIRLGNLIVLAIEIGRAHV